MKNKLILSGIALLIFFLFILTLFFILNKRTAQTTDSSLSDVNRSPSKTLIQNDNGTQQQNGDQNPSPTESPIDLDFSKRIDDDAQIDKSQLENSPDAYLFNKLPHDEATFSMKAVLGEGDNGSITFIVSSINNASTAQKDALSWMKSIGLTEAQINTLNITYP